MPGDEHGHDHGFTAAGGHLEGGAENARVGHLVGLAQVILDPGIAGLFGHLGDENGGLQGLNLAKKELLFPVGVLPIFQQPCGGLGGPQVAALPPHGHLGADTIDFSILCDALLGPFRIREVSLFALLFRFGDGNEVGAYPALGDDLVGDAFVGEAEVALGFIKRGVDDRIFDNDLLHGHPLDWQKVLIF